MKVAIVGQRGNERAVELAGQLAARLRADDARVVVDETTAGALAAEVKRWADLDPTALATADSFADCTLVVSIGGDGTFLYAARHSGGTPVLGINLGEVGFLNAVDPAAAVDTVLAELERVRGGDAGGQTAPRIAAAGEDWALEPAINEVVVEGPRRGHGGGATFTVDVAGATFTETHADGVLVATPTGSTAYNLSEDGPLVHPDVPGLVVTGMAPEDGMPSLVVPEGDRITVEVADAPAGVAVSDGRVRQPLSPPATVTLEVADEPVRIAGPSRDFFAALGKLD